MNAFTVDVEEWFHICGVDGPLAPAHWDALSSRVETTTDRLLDELDAAQVTATCFVVGWVADRHPALVARIRAAGHAIGSHSYWHRHVRALSEREFEADLTSSLRALADAGASRVTAFRAAEWSLNERTPWAFDVLARHQFRADASMAPVRIVGDVGYPRVPFRRQTSSGPLVEVPPFVVDRFGQAMPMGWGWALRSSTPRRVLRAMESANRAGRPAVLTVHPWEIDPDPPRVRLPLRLHVAHYCWLDGFLQRLRQILRGAVFSTFDAIADAV